MATEAQIKDQFGKGVMLFEEFRKYAAVNSVGAISNLLTRIDAITAVLEGDFANDYAATLIGLRSAHDAILNQGAGIIAPMLREYSKFIETPEVDVLNQFKRLRQYYVDNSLAVPSREFTFDTPAADGGNAGDGVINRLDVDKDGFDLEYQTPDSKVAKCVADEHSGTNEHEELFEFRGDAAERDFLKITGSGKTLKVAALSAAASQQVLGNPSFETLSGSAVTKFTNWTIAGTASNFEQDTTNYYRGFNGAGTPASIKCVGNDTISQNMNVKKSRFNPDIPYYFQCAVNRSIFSGSGTVTLTIGNVSANIVLAAQAGWQVLRIALGANNWYQNFNVEDLSCSIQVTNLANSILIDDVIISPMTQFDGAWYSILGGGTPFLFDDEFTWADTALENSILGYWFWVFFGEYLPSATGSAITWADPT